MDYRRVQRNITPTTGRQHRPDYMLLLFAMMLLGTGLIVVYAIGPGLSVIQGKKESYYITKQLVSVLLSLVAFAVSAWVPLSWWRTSARILAALAALSSLIVIGIGVATHTPTRWIPLGGISFQPAEFIKLSGILLLAGFLVVQRQRGQLTSTEHTFKPFAIALAVVGVAVAFIMRDLGSAVVIVGVMAIMLFMSGFPMRRILLLAAAVSAAGLLAIASTPYRRDRFFVFLHPEQDKTATGYHINQALIAVGSGGLIGLGLGNSVQAYGYLPEAANDSIFAVYSEKFGFFGSVAMVLLFGALLWRLLKIIERAPDDYARFVVVGIFSWVFIQSVINIGAMVGLLPLKGITLPLVSYGGSSLVFVMSGLGIVFQISRHTALRVSTARRGTGRI